jgi:hypothetical protein
MEFGMLNLYCPKLIFVILISLLIRHRFIKYSVLNLSSLLLNSHRSSDTLLLDGNRSRSLL